MVLENSWECRHDYVEIFDGRDFESSKSFGRYCGFDVPDEPLVTSGSNLLVQLITDQSLSHGGFKLVATAMLGL